MIRDRFKQNTFEYTPVEVLAQYSFSSWRARWIMHEPIVSRPPHRAISSLVSGLYVLRIQGIGVCLASVVLHGEVHTASFETVDAAIAAFAMGFRP